MVVEAKEIIRKTRKLAQKLKPENLADQSLLNEIHHVSQELERVVEQSELVNAGQTPKDRILSYEDMDARPIKKGKRGKPVEFGEKLQIVETNEGIVSDYSVHKGNPSDRNLISDVVPRHKKQFGRAPVSFAADRGYHSSKNENELLEQGVKHVSIPKPGKKSAKRTTLESNKKFKQQQRFRNGVEGRISCLKRRFGLRRSMLKGFHGTSTWCGFGILAHNLRQAARLKMA